MFNDFIMNKIDFKSKVLDMSIGDMVTILYNNGNVIQYERILGGFYCYRYGKISFNAILVLCDSDDFLFYIDKAGTLYGIAK